MHDAMIPIPAQSVVFHDDYREDKNATVYHVTSMLQFLCMHQCTLYICGKS